MKIGYFVTHYPYEKGYDDYFCGGVGAVAENLAKEMAKRGHEVLVFTTSMTRKYSFEEREGIKIYRYGANFRIAEAYMSLRLLFGPLRHEVDIVHAHMGNAPAPIAAWIYSKLKKKPLIVTYHGDQQDSYGTFLRRCSLKIYNKLLVNNILGSSSLVISPSEPFIEESKFLGSFRDRIKVIPNGINKNEVTISKTKENCRSELGIPHDKVVFLFVGALSKYKGPDVLLKSINRVAKKNEDVMLIYVGDGQMRSELESLSTKFGLEEIVKFAGFVEEQKKFEYFKAADVFVLPSTLNTEVFPIVLLEAAASKLPIVVSDLNTFKCFIQDGVNGIVTKNTDFNDLAGTLLMLSTDDDLRKKMGGNAYNIVADFSWEKIAEETEWAYGDLL